MPPPQRVRSHERADAVEEFSRDGFGFDSEASALLIVESGPLFAKQVMERPVFFHQEVDDVVLLLRQPPGQADDQQIESGKSHKLP